MTPLIVTVFMLVYLGMIFGGLPFVQLDRAGIALLGAILLVSTEAVSIEDVWQSLHMPTLILLFAFMVISAQMRLGGFYSWATRRLGILAMGPPALLGALIAVAAVLSAVFSNDVVCLAMAPVLVEICLLRRLDPVPYLLALACAANVGSAATLIGNPQNMLIGQTLNLSFGAYLAEAATPVVLGLVLTWGLIVGLTGGRWQLGAETPPEPAAEHREDHSRPLNLWQTGKGLTVTAALFSAFLLVPWPRELVALAGAGLLLTSRRLHSRHMLGLVDWQILVLFMGLFVVNHAMQRTGLPAHMVTSLAANGFDLNREGPLFVAGFLLSNLVSNVPAVMLLLPTASGMHAGTVLALSSTLAGNLFIVGSIANIIVVHEAERRGIAIDWRRHARVGVPVTLATLGITAVYLWLRAATPGPV
jgi:Na+/H+ antiporter NhaD/arsenite permease-like protein